MAPTFHCDRCGHCCRTHRVPLTREDLIRLRAARPEVKLGKFAAFVDPTEVDLVGEPESLLRLRQGLRLLALAHEDGGCVFLGSSGCTVHGARPMACRAYPFEKPRGNKRALELHPSMMCPPETGARDIASTPPEEQTPHEYLRFLNLRDKQSNAHAAWVLGWNRKQKLRLRLRRLPQEEDEALRALLLHPKDGGPSEEAPG